MIKLYRSLLVLAVMILMILGLNISNQGINSLTMEQRKPIMGLQNQGNNISVFTMGTTHNYSKQEIISNIMMGVSKLKIYIIAARDYLLRIIKIVRALLFNVVSPAIQSFRSHLSHHPELFSQDVWNLSLRR